MSVVGNARTCVVSFVDSGGIRHSVEVAAESLYEAAALAVNEFRQHPWVDDLEPGAVTPLSISVKMPTTIHEGQHSAIGKVDGDDRQEPS
jgi:hypothetical protein